MELTRNLAREAGITEEEIGQVANFRNSGLSPLERDVLEYAEAATLTPARIPEDLPRRLSAALDEDQMVELAAAIALQNFSARFNRAAGA